LHARIHYRPYLHPFAVEGIGMPGDFANSRLHGFAGLGLCEGENGRQAEAEYQNRWNSHVLLCGSGLCGAAGAAFGISGGFRVLPAIQVRTTFGCLPLSIADTILAPRQV
jgi:hypothetical protein